MAMVVHTQGLQFILELVNKVQSAPTNYYVGLATDASLAKTAVLGSQTELAASNGYTRQTIAASGVGLVSASDGGDGRKLTSATVTFTASGGDWSQALTLFVATTSDDSGKLIASGPINGGVGTTVTDGHTYSAEVVITLP